MSSLLLHLPHEKIVKLYRSLKKDNKKKTSIVLEPLQVIIQLSILNNCPKGTKLAVGNNLCLVDLPSYTQPIHRWYNNYSKDDLYYLFDVFRRYISWYITPNKENEVIFKYLLTQALGGLKELKKLYNDKITVSNLIQIYIQLLDNYEIFATSDIEEEEITMDNVFKKIKDYYTTQDITIMYHILKKIESTKEESQKKYYIKSIQYFLKPIHEKICEWINTNMNIM